MAAKMSVLGLILSSYPYLRSALVRFPLMNELIINYEAVFRTAPATPGLLNINNINCCSDWRAKEK